VGVLTNIFARSPAAARVTPFVVFLGLTICQGQFGPASADWFYLAKTIAGAWLLLAVRAHVPEMRWKISPEAVVVGLAVFALWVGLDPFYSKIFHTGATGDPFEASSPNVTLGWFFAVIHIIGMTVVVPPIEEIFYRSFVYRYIASKDFLSVPPGRFLPVPFFATAIIFGLSHNEWLAGIVCGMAFQWLVIRKHRLGDAMTAHAITNLLLGVWIVWQRQWHFW
jgi:CAAX protease family protein